MRFGPKTPIVPLVLGQPDTEANLALDRNANVSGKYTARNSRKIARGPTELLWDDVFGDVSQGTGPAVLTYEAFRDTGFMMYFFRHNQPDALYMRYQLPHRWDKTEVRPHLHYVPMSAGAGKFAVFGRFVWVNYNREIPANASWTHYAASEDLVAGDQYKEKILSLARCVPPNGSKESAILLISCIRDHLGADTYTTAKSPGTGAANIGLLSLDTHYRSEKSGTVSEY